MQSPRPIAFLLALALSVTVAAADKRPLTPQDLWAVKRLSSPALSPDGKTAVFTVQDWSIEKNKSTSSLWLVDVAGGTPRRLTNAPASDGSPVWSPDGTRLAFTSKRGDDEAASLYVMRTDGGEPEKILELPFGISAPRWMPDGQRLVIVTTVIPELAGALTPADLAAMKKEIKRRKDSKMTAKVTEDRQYRYFDHYITDSAANRLLVVTPATREFKDLTPKWDRLFTVSGEVTYDLAPDGKWIALTINTTPPPYRDFPNHDVYLLPTDGAGTLKNLTPENRGDDDGAVFAPDGKALLFGRQETPYYSGEFTKLWRHDLATGRNTPLTEALDYSIAGVKFSADGKTLWATIESKGIVPVFKLSADGTGLTPVYAQGTSSAIDLAAGTLVFLNDNTSRPNELFALDQASGAVRQLTHFNDAFMAQIDLGRVESYWFEGANREQVQGWLVYPPGYDANKKYPLIELMHGGPHTMNRDSWSYRWNTQLFAAPGYVVTWVNRHGSTGFQRAVLPEHPQPVGRPAVRGHHEGRRLPVEETAQPRPGPAGRRRGQLRRLHGGLGARPHRPLQGHHRPRRREQRLRPIRHRRAPRLPRGHGRQALGQCRGPAEGEPDVLRQEFQDADAHHAPVIARSVATKQSSWIATARFAHLAMTIVKKLRALGMGAIQ
jgi:dipeptidyl aminopeptidase/acylaminoacyl peptidase